jgi:hypothetical protein
MPASEPKKPQYLITDPLTASGKSGTLDEDAENLDQSYKCVQYAREVILNLPSNPHIIKAKSYQKSISHISHRHQKGNDSKPIRTSQKN